MLRARHTPRFAGTYASVENAINVPKAAPAATGADHGRRQRAERHLAPGREAIADELNLDGMTPDEVAEALPVIAAAARRSAAIRRRCGVSVHIWTSRRRNAGAAASTCSRATATWVSRG